MSIVPFIPILINMNRHDDDWDDDDCCCCKKCNCKKEKKLPSTTWEYWQDRRIQKKWKFWNTIMDFDFFIILFIPILVFGIIAFLMFDKPVGILYGLGACIITVIILFQLMRIPRYYREKYSMYNDKTVIKRHKPYIVGKWNIPSNKIPFTHIRVYRYDY